MLYAVLLLLLIGGTYGAFYTSRLYYDAAEGSSTALQETLKAMNEVSNLLADGSANTVQISDNPVGFRVLCATGPQNLFEHNQNGELLWQSWRCIYYDDQKDEIVMKISALAAPSAQVPNSGPTVAEMVANNSAEQRVLARNISAFEITPGANDLVAFNIAAATETRKFGTNEIRLQSQVHLRQ